MVTTAGRSAGGGGGGGGGGGDVGVGCGVGVGGVTRGDCRLTVDWLLTDC